MHRWATFFKTAAVMALLILVGQLALAVCGMPRGFLRWISAASFAGGDDPEVIVVLGGGSLPSEASLIRAYTGAEAAKKWPNARIVVSMPDEAASLRDELVLRGVAAERILLENEGRGTHGQAAAVWDLFREDPPETVLLVSSPLHLRRAFLCFRKRFESVRVRGTYSEAFDVEDGVTLRYGFWANLQAQPVMLRELMAMGYYKIRGRI